MDNKEPFSLRCVDGALCAKESLTNNSLYRSADLLISWTAEPLCDVFDAALLDEVYKDTLLPVMQILGMFLVFLLS